MRYPALMALSLATAGAWLPAIETIDIPADAPDDAVMAPAQEIARFQRWVQSAFSGDTVSPSDANQLRLELRRQDHGDLGFGRSCIGTPLRIGTQPFRRGLGTHANSEIVLHLPEGARAFRAAVGVDNNHDTQGRRGSVQFTIEAGGKEIHRTAVLKAGQPPVSLDLPLPPGTRRLFLKVETTADGPAHDHADWADARVLLADGRELWADEEPLPFWDGSPPFSFIYNHVSTTVLLPQWKRETTTASRGRRQLQTHTWNDHQTGLRVIAEVTTFQRYPAVEWVLHFENTGAEDSPVLEQVHALAASLRTGYMRQPLTVRRLNGDVCGEQSFMPIEDTLTPGQILAFAPGGGRPSNGAFPFFNIEYDRRGIIAALGWSGQWSVRLERFSHGRTALQAGMERTRLRLRPGERIRTPRILLMSWEQDLLTAQNRFRRLLLFEYVPKLNGRPLPLPVASQCFDRYVNTRPDWATEVGQLRAIQATRDLGCDTHWFDAAWFEGGFPNGVGNWFCKPNSFPRGLAPMAAACHQHKLKYLVWFEPERVAPGTQIAREHPEFVLGGTNGGLFKLNEPAARQWLTDLLSRRITEFGLAVYRNDFNLDPLGHWRQADPPEREGITEIRYVEGHYALWDELRDRHPGLWIDNCASGGRRIDLETLSRSVTLWRSDTGCSPGHEEWDQTQVLGFAPFVPLFSSCAWEPRAYITRSAAAAGAIFQFDYLNPNFDWEAGRAAVAEAAANQKFWYGDFYPLIAPGANGWAAWQCHRADLNAGIALAFRRRNSPYAAFQAALRALQPDLGYRVEFIDEYRRLETRTLRGQELMNNVELRIAQPGSSLLVRYQPQQ